MAVQREVTLRYLKRLVFGNLPVTPPKAIRLFPSKGGSFGGLCLLSRQLNIRQLFLLGNYPAWGPISTMKERAHDSCYRSLTDSGYKWPAQNLVEWLLPLEGFSSKVMGRARSAL